jgi:hypothetical protein
MPCWGWLSHAQDGCILSSAHFLGWLGVALTGSDTSSNALFGSLQRITSQQLGIDPDSDVRGQQRWRSDGQNGGRAVDHHCYCGY